MHGSLVLGLYVFRFPLFTCRGIGPSLGYAPMDRRSMGLGQVNSCDREGDAFGV